MTSTLVGKWLANLGPEVLALHSTPSVRLPTAPSILLRMTLVRLARLLASRISPKHLAFITWATYYAGAVVRVVSSTPSVRLPTALSILQRMILVLSGVRLASLSTSIALARLSA